MTSAHVCTSQTHARARRCVLARLRPPTLALARCHGSPAIRGPTRLQAGLLAGRVPAGMAARPHILVLVIVIVFIVLDAPKQ